MSIQLECINVIIPISTIIDHIGLHGFKQHLGEGTSHDDFLYRIGAMNQMDVELIINSWEKQGLKPTGKRNGELYWKDLCVVDSFQGPTMLCDWLEFDAEDQVVRYKGKDGRVRL